jgi:hypothetical protein
MQHLWNTNWTGGGGVVPQLYHNPYILIVIKRLILTDQLTLMEIPPEFEVGSQQSIDGCRVPEL